MAGRHVVGRGRARGANSTTLITMTHGPRILWSQLRIGVAVGSLAVAAAFGVFFVDQVSDACETRYTLYFHTFTTQILRLHAPVWLAGQPIGHVVSLEFQPPAEGLGERLTVELSVRSEAQPFILEGSVAQVITAGLLGQAVVNIVPAASSAPVIPSGGELPTASELDPFELVRRLRTTYDSLQPLADRWRAVMELSRNGPGTFSKVLKRPGEIEELRRQIRELGGTLDGLGGAATEIRRIVTDDEVQAALHRIVSRLSRLGDTWDSDDRSPASSIFDPAFRARLDRIDQQMTRIARSLETGQGTLGRLLNDRALATEWTKVRAALAELRAELQALAAGRTPRGN